MKIGYIRVSKHEQNEALQVDALQTAGCEKLFRDSMTGVKFERKGLDEVLASSGNLIGSGVHSKISSKLSTSSKTVEWILSV